jgi:hypothetical protein
MLWGNPPVAGFTTLNFGQQVTSEKWVMLSNSLGETLRRFVIPGTTTMYDLDVRQLPSGVYFVHVRIGDHYYTRSFVK